MVLRNVFIASALLSVSSIMEAAEWLRAYYHPAKYYLRAPSFLNPLWDQVRVNPSILFPLELKTSTTLIYPKAEFTMNEANEIPVLTRNNMNVRRFGDIFQKIITRNTKQLPEKPTFRDLIHAENNILEETTKELIENKRKLMDTTLMAIDDVHEYAQRLNNCMTGACQVREQEAKFEAELRREIALHGFNANVNALNRIQNRRNFINKIKKNIDLEELMAQQRELGFVD
jgi:hypothetical protein